MRSLDLSGCSATRDFARCKGGGLASAVLDLASVLPGAGLVSAVLTPPERRRDSGVGDIPPGFAIVVVSGCAVFARLVFFSTALSSVSMRRFFAAEEITGLSVSCGLGAVKSAVSDAGPGVGKLCREESGSAWMLRVGLSCGAGEEGGGVRVEVAGGARVA